MIAEVRLTYRVDRGLMRLPMSLIPQPVIAETAYGIERLPRSRRRSVLQGRFDLICAEIPRVQWTDAVTQAYGRV